MSESIITVKSNMLKHDTAICMICILNLENVFVFSKSTRK